VRAIPRCLSLPLLAWVALLPPLPARAQASPPAKLAASIARVFGRGSRVDALHVDSSTVLRVSRGDSLLGFAEVGNVIGKDQPITFLVAIGPDDRLKDVDILVYREPRGGEVAYEAWRKQFRGKTAADSVRVGKGIRSISGATISVHAVTAGVRRMLADLTTWHRTGAIR
jgi:transcriptional regulator of nitric oxide reductase